MLGINKLSDIYNNQDIKTFDIDFSLSEVLGGVFELDQPNVFSIRIHARPSRERIFNQIKFFLIFREAVGQGQNRSDSRVKSSGDSS